jgi:putative DNA primase/helicase
MNLEKLLMLVGNGSNGKSVFFNVISALVGRENILNYSMGLFSHPYQRAKLTDVLLNYSSEKGTDLEVDTFKALISGEPLQAREPYGKSFTIRNKVRFIINTNELPRETEQSEAYFRRFLIVPFEVTIKEDQRDISLADKIIKNELSGVFNWLLRGLDRIITQRGFTDCRKSKLILADFRKQSDNVGLFIDEFKYIPSGKNKIPLSDLYFRYRNFCQDEGFKSLGKNKFSVRLEKKGFEKDRLNNGSIAFCLESTTGTYNP